MKIISRRTAAVVAAIALSSTSGFAAGSSQTRMLRDAKVDRTHAEGVALGVARGGTIKTSEIEREHGRLVWSFDIAMPNTRDITEVLVDAKTGKVVSVQKENAAKEAAEARAEAKDKKH